MLALCIAYWTAEKSTSEDEETEEEEDGEKKPKKKTVKETTYEWERLNDMKAIWLRSPKEVTDEEYRKFYTQLAKVVINIVHFQITSIFSGSDHISGFLGFFC